MSDLIRMSRAQCCPTPPPSPSSNDAPWSSSDPLRTVERQADASHAAMGRYLNRLARSTGVRALSSVGSMGLPSPHMTFLKLP